MRFHPSRSLFLLGMLACCLSFFGAAFAQVTKAGVSVGIQPLGIPSGVISAVMQRDRVLQRALQASGGVRFVPFAKGADIVPKLAEHQVQVGLLGDMPTLLATVNRQGVIVGLIKQTSTAIVARGVVQLSDLAGKRIGYVPMSSAHHTLLQGLRSAGLREDQVRLVALPVNDLPDALARGELDAFAAWEPGPALALAVDRRNRVVFRGRTSDYLVLDRAFVESSPEAALQVVAAFARAIEWMRRSQVNLNQAVQWLKQDVQAYVGKPLSLPDEQIARITRQDILDVPAAPVIPGRLTNPPLHGEFDFLRSMGKLPPNASWDAVMAAFQYDGLATVLAQARRYNLSAFDYAD